MKTKEKKFLSQVALAMFVTFSGVTADAREKVSLNLGWKYQAGIIGNAQSVGFNDKGWQIVNLPHDAQVIGPFVKKGQGASNRNGYRPQGRGWYRKTLNYDKAWLGKRIVLEFEGVYRDAKVYVNGQLCEGKNPNGYLDFEFDITDKLQQGANVIAVSYDNAYSKSSRWYNGEGINRDVWLHVLEDVHVARYGTYVTTPKITPAEAKVNIKTNIKNERTDSVLCRLITEIISPEGKTVAAAEAVAPFAGGETYLFNQDIAVLHPQLWNVGDGKMYKAVSHVYVAKEKYNGNVRQPMEWTSLGGAGNACISDHADIPANAIDTYETPFGIREIEMTPNQGLLVNGKRVYINGACLHTDLGPLGTASFEEGWNQRLTAITQKLECNGIRLSHNAYPKYVLDWADRHGILVVDEFFDKWDDSFYGQGAKFGSLHLRDVRVQMERDRNHPSVFIWSVGNEVYQQIQAEQTRKNGIKQLKTLLELAHQIDPTRKATCSQYPNRYGSITRKRDVKRFEGAEPHQFEFYTDVVCTNYLEKFWDEDHKRFPQLVFMEGEMAVGDLGYDYFNFDHSYPVGHFYWGGTDYIGESFGWPSKGWIRGLASFTNHLKPLGWSVKSFYAKDPMVKIITRPNKGQGGLVWNDLKMTWIALDEHWNYEAGDQLKVQVMSNCDETELFLNGKSLGKKQLPPKTQAPELTWDVAYEKGELKAIGYNKGVKVSEDVLATAGKPAKIVVNLSKEQLKGNGMDLAYLDYTVLDAQGNICPDIVKLNFEVKGEGVNAGVANDDMMSDEPWQANGRSTYRGKCQLIVRSNAIAAGKSGKIVVKAKAKGLKTLSTVINVK